MASLYTHEEVAKHNTRDDLWMIIGKKVYSITAFIDEHPGGDEILLEEGASDATNAFEDIGHSPDAYKLLEKYYIGDMDPKSKPVEVIPPVTVNTINKQAKGNPLRIIIFVVFFFGYVYWRFF